jgi:hemerythrin
MMKENSKVEESSQIVVWDNKYATRIEKIDSQHKHLFDLTNRLYNACFDNDDVLETKFKEAMKQMVEYVRFHFDAEQKFLKAIGYPDYQNHKKQHDSLVQDILVAVKDYQEGKKHIPNNFVRTLKDWILSHIAFYDKIYSAYALNQVKLGILTEKKLQELC